MQNPFQGSGGVIQVQAHERPWHQHPHENATCLHTYSLTAGSQRMPRFVDHQRRHHCYMHAPPTRVSCCAVVALLPHTLSLFTWVWRSMEHPTCSIGSARTEASRPTALSDSSVRQLCLSKTELSALLAGGWPLCALTRCCMLDAPCSKECDSWMLTSEEEQPCVPGCACLPSQSHALSVCASRLMHARTPAAHGTPAAHACSPSLRTPYLSQPCMLRPTASHHHLQ